MTIRPLLALAVLLCALARPVLADQAAGQVQAAARGTFTLDENGTLRLFNLSSRSTVYEPASWRPTVGDRVDVAFVVSEGKLVVNQATLVEAGPNTLPELPSPAAVRIVEKGRTGIIAQLDDGRSVRFSATRGTVWDPAGWMPTPGERATVEFQVLRERFGFGVVFEATKIAKQADPAE